MAANVNIIQGARIVANGGEITSDRYINDSSNDLTAGELCYMSAGKIIPVSTSAASVDTDNTGIATGKLFIALKDVDVSEDLAGNVPVQAIEADTVLEGYVVDSTVTGDVTMDVSDIGVSYAGYISATGGLAVDNGNTTKPIVKIEDVDSNYEPYRMGGDFEKDSAGVRHQRVRFKFLSTVIA